MRFDDDEFFDDSDHPRYKAKKQKVSCCGNYSKPGGKTMYKNQTAVIPSQGEQLQQMQQDIIQLYKNINYLKEEIEELKKK